MQVRNCIALHHLISFQSLLDPESKSYQQANKVLVNIDVVLVVLVEIDKVNKKESDYYGFLELKAIRISILYYY